MDITAACAPSTTLFGETQSVMNRDSSGANLGELREIVEDCVGSARSWASWRGQAEDRSQRDDSERLRIRRQALEAYLAKRNHQENEGRKVVMPDFKPELRKNAESLASMPKARSRHDSPTSAFLLFSTEGRKAPG